MRQIQYNNAAFGLRFEYPHEWDAESITGVTLTVKDLSGVELLAAASTTLFSAANIQVNGGVVADTDQFLIELTASGTIPDFVPGDRMRIAQSASGPAEDVEILNYNTTTELATLTRDMRYAHADNTRLYGLYCTYDLDTSDTDVFPLNKQVVLTWTPDTDDLPVRERGEIVISEFRVLGFEERFAALHPREYRISMSPERRLFRFLEEAHFQLGNELRVRGLYIDRVVDQAILVPALMAKVRWLILLNGDDAYREERQVCLDEYVRQFDLLTTGPIWADDDQDEVRDDEELNDYGPRFWERGL